jgi:hypothetical protein
MPAKAAWLLRIPDIVALLESFVVPVVDRAIVERLFGLRRRRAIELLHRFGGYQAGRTFLIDRKILIEQLQRLAEAMSSRWRAGAKNAWTSKSIDSAAVKPRRG